MLLGTPHRPPGASAIIPAYPDLSKPADIIIIPARSAGYSRYSVADPTGPLPGGRRAKLSERNAPTHDPAAANAT